MVEFTGPAKEFNWSSEDLKDKKGIVPFQIACCRGYKCMSCEQISGKPETIKHKDGCPNTDLLKIN